MSISNIERLQNVADGFDELNEKITYVGGAVTGLYPNGAAASSHQTMDVDCVVEYYSFQQKEDFESVLHQKHFCEDTEGAVICRWNYKGYQVDIMPTDERYFQFTNRWYTPGVKNRQSYVLPNGRTIYIMPALYFVATKMEAINSRAGSDYRGSTDFEDVVYILNYCPDFVERCKREENRELVTFLAEQSDRILKRSNIHEEIECSLPSGEEGRTEYILEIFKAISALR
jgi:hypothetical protein